MDKRQSDRSYRIRAIENILIAATQQKKKISKEKLIADLGLRTGLARRTVLEYFQALINAGKAHYEKEESGEIALVLGRDEMKTIDFEIQQILSSQQVNRPKDIDKEPKPKQKAKEVKNAPIK